MSERNSRSKLPPISPKPAASEGELGEQHAKKPKKKKSARSHSEEGGTRERSSSGSKSGKKKHSPHRKSAQEDQENLDPITQTEPTPKKKKKKKPQGASREALMSGEEPLTDRSNKDQRTTHKKKKKKKKKSAVTTETEEESEYDDTGLPGEFSNLKEDVVIADDAEQRKLEEQQAIWTTQPTMRSEPISKVFIEQRGGFKTADRHKLARQRQNEAARHRDAQMAPPDQKMNTMQLSLTTEKVYHKIALSLQGIFAGLALWQIVEVYSLSGYGFDIFLDYYHERALVVQSIYFFLFAVCTVDVLDRYDFGRPSRRLFQRAFTLQSGAVVCLFYLLGLIVSTTIAATDEKIALYKYDDTLWENPDALNPNRSRSLCVTCVSSLDRDSELSTWRILNLVRGLCLIIGWLLVSFCIKPTTHRLMKNLIKADENILMQLDTNNFNNLNSVAPPPERELNSLPV